MLQTYQSYVELCRELVCITVKWTWYINWQIIGISWLKTHYFSQFTTKMGFCCKILSLNDLTPSPISRPVTHCLQWQLANARANLWLRHEPFPGETSIALRPCAGKAGVAKRSWWCLGIIPSNRCCQFSMINQILEEIPLTERRTSSANHLFTLYTAAHADHREAIPLLHVKYRAHFLLGVGRGGMSYWVYVTLSCHNWKHNDFRYSGACFIYYFCVSHKCVIGRLFTA